MGLHRGVRRAWMGGLEGFGGLRGSAGALEVGHCEVVPVRLGGAGVAIDPASISMLAIEDEVINVLHGKLLHEGLVSERFADAGYVGSSHVVAGYARKVVVCTQPFLLHYMLKATLLNRVLGKLTHVDRA
jgi:hypothetical protein